jgi:hypothetical protein
VIADLLPRCRPRVLLRVRRRWWKSTAHASGAPTSPAARTGFQHGRRLSRKSGRCRSSQHLRSIIARCIPAYSVAQSSCVAFFSARWKVASRVPARIRVWLSPEWRIAYESTMVCTPTTIIWGRIGRRLEPICLWWRCLSCPTSRLRCMRERLYVMRVKNKVVKIRNLDKARQYFDQKTMSTPLQHTSSRGFTRSGCLLVICFSTNDVVLKSFRHVLHLNFPSSSCLM